MRRALRRGSGRGKMHCPQSRMPPPLRRWPWHCSWHATSSPMLHATSTSYESTSIVKNHRNLSYVTLHMFGLSSMSTVQKDAIKKLHIVAKICWSGPNDVLLHMVGQPMAPPLRSQWSLSSDRFHHHCFNPCRFCCTSSLNQTTNRDTHSNCSQKWMVVHLSPNRSWRNCSQHWHLNQSLWYVKHPLVGLDGTPTVPIVLPSWWKFRGYDYDDLSCMLDRPNAINFWHPCDNNGQKASWMWFPCVLQVARMLFVVAAGWIPMHSYGSKVDDTIVPRYTKEAKEA